MKSDKVTVSEENGKVFETVFGKDAKADNVEYTKKKESVIKSMVDGGNTPLGLKIVSSVFGYLQSFFTMFLPLGLIISTCIKHEMSFNKDLIYSILIILGISTGSFCILKIVEFLISALLISFYSNALTKLSGRTAVLQERIRSHLKTEDVKNQETKPEDGNPGVTYEYEDNGSMNPEDSPMAMKRSVDRLKTIFISSIQEDPNNKEDLPDDNTLTRIFMTILFNLYKNGCNGKFDASKDIAIQGVEEYPISIKVFIFIMEMAKSTAWFTKAF